MPLVKPDGAVIRRLRKAHPTASKQVEFARRAGISDRQLRDYENDDRPIHLELLKRFASILGTTYQTLMEQVPAAKPSVSEPQLMPRHDTTYLRVIKDELALHTLARRSNTVVPHVLVPLNEELSRCAEELVEVLRNLTWSLERRALPDDDPDFARRRRIRELIVTLKGNDIWIYADDHLKRLPVSDEYQLDYPSDLEWQTIIAFGAQGEYGEDTVSVPIDHGRPWMLRPFIDFSSKEVPGD